MLSLISTPSFLHSGTVFFLVFLLFILPKGLLLFVLICFARYNSVGFLAVQTLSLYFLTSQMFSVCEQYIWHSVWTLLISSTFFLVIHPGYTRDLFLQRATSCWLQLCKSNLSNLLYLFCTTEQT